MSRYILVAIWVLGCRSEALEAAGATSSPIVYGGVDDREDVYDHPSALFRSIAQSSTALLMDGERVNTSNPDNVTLGIVGRLFETQNLCVGERFENQPVLGDCSGTLIDDQHILTAEHCIDGRACDSSQAWVFGVYLEGPDDPAPLTQDEVYYCDEVVVAAMDGDVDFAVVRLDRRVVGHDAVPLRPLPEGLAEGTPLTMIGHPNGIPTKITAGGRVIENDLMFRWLTADLDAFRGNSGSGVFDDDGNLVAILDSGGEDYFETDGCNIVNYASDRPPRWEGLTYLAPALDTFCETGVDSVACTCEGCGSDEPGDTCELGRTILPGTLRIEGSLEGYTDTSAGSCGGAGADRHWRFTVDGRASFAAQTEGFDSVLYLRRADGGSCGSELACNDDIAEGELGSSISADLEPGTYVLTLDSYDVAGEFGIDIEIGVEERPQPGSDAGPPPADAGVFDAGAGMDGGVRRDAGGAPPADDSGCSATGRNGGTGSFVWLLMALVLALRRRSVA